VRVESNLLHLVILSNSTTQSEHISGDVQSIKALFQSAQAKSATLSKYVNERDADNRTPLMNAAEKGRVDIVQLLLQHNANVNAVDNLGFTAEDIANKNMHVLGM
jgi:ankyrin repeat protein